MSSNIQGSDFFNAASTNGAEEPERLSTDLHRACADPSVTIDRLKVILNADRSAAAIKDQRGRLPLHVVAQNRELRAAAGKDLDSFILDELLASHHRASSTPDDGGAIPFVAAIGEWIELTHGFPRGTPQESGDASSVTSSQSRSDPEIPDEPPDGDKLDKVIPPRLTVTPVVSWSIHMLSNIVDRERRSTSFIVESVASIPSFLKALLLIEDDEERAELFRTTIVCQALLCSESVGPWLVWMLKSDKRVAQERAVIYLEAISTLRESSLRETLTSPSSRSVLFREKSSNEKKKHDIYLKATELPGLIQAMLHLERSLFERAASTGIVQFILDQQMFQPRTLFVIVLDISFLSLVIVFFILSSEAFFSIPEMTEVVPTLYRDETIWELCRNGTIVDVHGPDAFSSYCIYFRDNAPRDTHYDDPIEALNHEICAYTFYYKEGLVQANTSLPSAGVVSYSCKDNMTFYPNETIYWLCGLGYGSQAAASWEAHNLSLYDNVGEFCRYYYAEKYGGYYYYVWNENYYYQHEQLLLDSACSDPRSSYRKGLTEQKPDHITSNSTVAVVCMQWYWNTAWTLVVGMTMITLGGGYFSLRHLCAWHSIPRRLWIRKFGFWSMVDIVSIAMAVSMQGVFVSKARSIPYRYAMSADSDFLVSGSFMQWIRSYIEDTFQNEALLRSFAAITSGLLCLKGLGYFKMLNRYLATFVYALGVIAEDIFWFVCIVLLIIMAFSQMFYTILSGRECTSGTGDQSPFCKVRTTYLYVYTILLGNFDIEDFSTTFSMFLFAVYSFAGIIVVLNFLIAIISDSYDKSMTKISNHFGRARVLFVVEVNAFLDFFRAKDLFATRVEVHDAGTAPRLLRGWRGFRRCMWGSTRLHCIWSFLGVGGFITAPTVLVGIFARSRAGFLVGVVLVPILSFFLSIWIAGGIFDKNTCFVKIGNFLLQNSVSRFAGKWLGKFLLFVFHFILGRSGEGTTTTDDVGDKEWSGRMHHIKEEMSNTVLESEARIRVDLSQKAKESESCLKHRMDKLDEELHQIKRLLSRVESLIEKKDDAGPNA